MLRLLGNNLYRFNLWLDKNETFKFIFMIVFISIGIVNIQFGDLIFGVLMMLLLCLFALYRIFMQNGSAIFDRTLYHIPVVGFKDEGMAQKEVLNLSKDCPCPFKDKMFTQGVSFIDSLNTEKRTVISIRDGVQEYLGLELGLEPFDKVFKIYRSPETIRRVS